MIRIDYVREFVKLADTLNFSKASEELFISQPSLSRHISLLETDLGVKLLERNTRYVCLTRAGAALYKDFCRLIAADMTVRAHAKSFSSGFSGLIRICSPFYWNAAYIEPLILAFSARRPDVKIELNLCDPVEGIRLLERDQADICVGFSLDTMRDELAYVKLADERLCLVMPAQHPLSARETVSLRECAGEKFIILDLDETHVREQTALQLLLSRYGIQPSQIVYSQDPATLSLDIRQTGALCILMQSIGTLHRDFLASVPLADEDCAIPLYLFYRKDSTDDMVKAFLDTVPREG